MRRLDNYASAVAGYKRFPGRRTFSCSWFEPPRQEWSQGGLTVRVSPEVGLALGCQRHVLKLFLTLPARP